MAPSEKLIVALALLGIAELALYRCFPWLQKGPRTPDPWGKEVEDALEQGEAPPLCHHCLAPQEHNGWFCPECGATVGPYAYYLPWVKAFSQGEVLRAGVNERFRHTPLIVTGFILLPLFLFLPLAPFYWFFLFRNLSQGAPAGSD